MRLEPVPAPPEVVAAKTAELKVLQARVAALLEARRPLAQGAERSARRAFWSLAGALVAHAAVLVKLIFFSRFGWDTLEPVTYFITLEAGTSLLCFQSLGIDFTYEALHAALVGRYMRKAVRARRFDETRFQVLADAVVKKHRELAVLPGVEGSFYVQSWLGIASARATAEAAGALPTELVESVYVVNRSGDLMKYNFLTGELSEDPAHPQ